MFIQVKCSFKEHVIVIHIVYKVASVANKTDYSQIQTGTLNQNANEQQSQKEQQKYLFLLHPQPCQFSISNN